MAESGVHLTASQWTLLRAMEIGSFDAGSVADDLERLRRLALIEAQGDQWMATDAGRLLLAMRRGI